MINFGFNRHTDKDNKDHFFALQELFEADHQWSQPINPLTPKISLVILLYCLSYSSCDVN